MLTENFGINIDQRVRVKFYKLIYFYDCNLPSPCRKVYKITGFMAACFFGNLQVVKFLIDTYPSVLK